MTDRAPLGADDLLRASGAIFRFRQEPVRQLQTSHGADMAAPFAHGRAA